jgi:hypothetical protein
MSLKGKVDVTGNAAPDRDVGAGSIGAALAAHLILAGNTSLLEPDALTASPRRTISGKTSIIRSARSSKQSRKVFR